MKGPIKDRMIRFGVSSRFGPDHFFPTMPTPCGATKDGLDPRLGPRLVRRALAKQRNDVDPGIRSDDHKHALAADTFQRPCQSPGVRLRRSPPEPAGPPSALSIP